MANLTLRILLLVVALFLFIPTGCVAPSEEADAPGEPVGDWTVLGPGGGGSTFIPTISPHDPATMLVRCDMSGAYLTRDGGKQWKMLNFPGGAQAFAFDPSNPETMYVGATGVHRSTDGGRTWGMIFPRDDTVVEIQSINDHAMTSYVTTDNFPQDPGTTVRSIFIDPANPDHILAAISSGSVNGVFRSQNAGKAWDLALESADRIVRILSLSDSERSVLVFTRNSWRILDLDTGEAGADNALGPDVAPISWVESGLDPASGSPLLWSIRQDNREGDGGLLTSLDRGRSWRAVEPIDPPAEAEGRRPSFNYVATSRADGRVAYLVCNRSWELNERGEVGLWYGILKTVDAGESWDWVYRAGGGSEDYTIRDGWAAENVKDSWVREAFEGEFIAAINVGVSPKDPDLAVFTDWYRVMKTTDGGELWEATYAETLPDGRIRSRGLDVTTCYGIHFDPFDQDHIAISYTDIGYFHSYDRGKTWKRSVEGVPPAWDNTCYWMQFDPEVKSKLWSAWSSLHDIPKLKMIRNPRWQEFAVGGVCVSTDGGNSWTVSSDGLPETSPTTSLVLDPTSPVNQRVLYAAVYGQGVYKSVDDGKSWQSKSEGLGRNLNAWELVLSPDGALYLVITHNTQFENGVALPDLLDGEVYRSTDGAESWQKVQLPEGSRFPNSISVDPSDPKRLYVALWASMMKADFGRFEDGRTLLESNGGVLMSEDAGANWKPVFDSKAYVYGTTVDPNQPERLYLVTFHNSAYRSEDRGNTWQKIPGYSFRWGHRPIIDPLDPEWLYITTFGGSLFHGKP
ncbi:MAG: hypothetical protein JSU96_05370 [Acidobacteriota bacterium]|nr:MAG: hypothetical protein JSU96_05370 [Acidobacteriota bacterium]